MVIVAAGVAVAVIAVAGAKLLPTQQEREERRLREARLREQRTRRREWQVHQDARRLDARRRMRQEWDQDMPGLPPQYNWEETQAWRQHRRERWEERQKAERHAAELACYLETRFKNGRRT